MEEQMAKARAAKQRVERAWLAIEGIVGIGIGFTSRGAVGIIVSTREDPAALREKIPREVNGVPVELQRTGDIRAL